MPTDAQINANRANARLSSGPRTEEGKRRSRLNACRHGLTGQILFFTAEEQSAFDRHCAGIVDSFKPVGALETELAHSIAEDRWRLRRIRAIENAIFALSVESALEPTDTAAAPSPDPLDDADLSFAQARAWIDNSRQLELLSLYEHRLQRNLDRVLRQLETLQAQREAHREKVIAEEFALAKLDDVRDLRAYLPAQHLNHSDHRFGFDFSEPELKSIIKRRSQLDQARMLVERDWDPNRMPSNWPGDDYPPLPPSHPAPPADPARPSDPAPPLDSAPPDPLPVAA
jgi:hypothetical protein